MAACSQYRHLAYLLVFLMSGCLQQGRPVVTDHSPDIAPSPRPAPVSRPRIASQPQTRVPVSESSQQTRLSGQHIVKKGETLYSIAWRYGLDYRKLAAANRIPSPYLIRAQEVITLAEVEVEMTPAPVKPAKKARPSKQQGTRKPAKTPAPAAWKWPVQYVPSRNFTRVSKGVDFVIPPGQLTAVQSASGGKVVYAGNGIGGFERLVIVKHSDLLLSAYSFNGDITVREQEAVKTGQKIAEIASVTRAGQKLHFEVRRAGEPFDPRSVIR